MFRLAMAASLVLTGLAASGACALAADEAARGDEVSFSRDVAPILVKNCLACHGADEPQGEFQLHTFELMNKAGQSGATPITPSSLDESELYRLISSEEDFERMPKDADPLPVEHIATIRRWIEQGAKYDAADPKADVVSIVPRLPHAPAPERYAMPVPVAALAFSPDGRELAAGGYHEVTIWEAETGRLVRRIGDVVERVYGLAWSADGRTIAVAGGTPGVSGEAALYDAASGAFLMQLGKMADTAFAVAFNPAGDKLAVAAGDRSIRIFDVATGEQQRIIEDHADWVQSIAWSSDGARLVSASRDKTSKLFDAATGDSLVTYPEHGDAVYSAVFSADGAKVYSVGADKRIHAWPAADAKKGDTIGGFGGDVYKVLLAGDRIVACSGDKSVRTYADDKGADLHKLEGHNDHVYALVYDPGAGRLATSSYDGEVRVWNLADGALVTSFIAAPGL